MHSLSDISPVFAKIDQTSEEDFPKLDKALRNLTQRLHLPPSDQRGRIFLYDRAAVASIRLAYLAHECGLDRLALEPFARWMTQAGSRRKKVDGGKIGISNIEEAIDRANDGETFNVHVIFLDSGRTRCTADWTLDEPRSERVERNLQAIDTAEEIARFSMPASRLISRLLAELD